MLDARPTLPVHQGLQSYFVAQPQQQHGKLQKERRHQLQGLHQRQKKNKRKTNFFYQKKISNNSWKLEIDLKKISIGNTGIYTKNTISHMHYKL